MWHNIYCWAGDNLNSSCTLWWLLFLICLISIYGFDFHFTKINLQWRKGRAKYSSQLSTFRIFIWTWWHEILYFKFLLFLSSHFISSIWHNQGTWECLSLTMDFVFTNIFIFIIFLLLTMLYIYISWSDWYIYLNQVSHHPPMSAAHAENEHFVYDITSKVKTKFLGNSLDVYPLGR